MRNLPAITPKQLQILLLVYKFRFIHTQHLQLILKHKNPHRIQAWLKDLLDKKYLLRHYSRKSFYQGSQPAIYYLASLSRHVLKDCNEVSEADLTKVYKESKRSSKFITHCLSLADLYIFFDSQKKSTEELHFFTKSGLSNFTHFPNPLPDAYMAVKNASVTTRHFIEVFDDYTPSFAIRKRIKDYFTYSENGMWQEHTQSNLPKILLICPNERVQKHVYWYTKSLLQKSFNDGLSFFLTIKDTLVIGKRSTVWKKVETI